MPDTSTEGWGGRRLLESYEAERKPIAPQTIDLASANMAKLSTNFADPRLNSPGPYGDACRAEVGAQIQVAKDGEFHNLGPVLGYDYGAGSGPGEVGSPVIVADATAVPPSNPSVYVPTARPGARLPHLWLADGRSIYDALGSGFTLLRVESNADARAWNDAAASLGVLLDVVDLAALGCSPDDVDRLYGAALVLVRPDQHVAWRGPSVDVDTALSVILQVAGRV